MKTIICLISKIKLTRFYKICQRVLTIFVIILTSLFVKIYFGIEISC